MAIYSQGQGYCSQLCQHPSCWMAHRLEEKGILLQQEGIKLKETKYQGLPTQKIVNLSTSCEDLPFDKGCRIPSGKIFPAALMDRILKCSNNSVPQSKHTAGEISEQRKTSDKVNKLEVHTLNAEDVIGDSRDAIMPTKVYVWVPNPQRMAKESDNDKLTKGKMAVTTLSVDKSPSSPIHRYEPSVHSTRLRYRQQFSGNTLVRSSKENSSITDLRDISGWLSRSRTMTFPDGLTPFNQNASRTLTDNKKNSRHDQTTDVQLMKSNEKQTTEVTNLKQLLPPIDDQRCHQPQAESTKQPKYSSILLEPKFECCQRKSCTASGTEQTFNFGGSRQTLGTLCQQDDDPDILDLQKWFKIETQPLHTAVCPIRVPYGGHNQSSSTAPATSPLAVEPAPATKSTHVLPRNKSSTSLKETTVCPPVSPMCRTGSKIVTFTPPFCPTSGQSISLIQSLDGRRRSPAKISSAELLEVKASRRKESPFPPCPSPEPKMDFGYSDTVHAQDVGDVGDTGIELKLTSRPPENVEDESFVRTPALSNLANSRESSKELVSFRRVSSQGIVYKETESGTNQGGCAWTTSDNLDSIASDIVAKVLVAASDILTLATSKDFDDCDEENSKHANKTLRNSLSNDLAGEKEAGLDAGFKALRPKYTHDKVQCDTEAEIDRRLKNDPLDQFDTTENDFTKELRKEFDKLC